MGDALYTVRHLLAGLLGDRLIVGQATGGSATTLVDVTKLVQEDDDWNGAWLYIYDGPLAGQERLVSDFVQSTRTLTVSPTWTVTPSWTAPTTASKYELHKRFNVLDSYNPMISMAFKSARKRTLLAKTNGSLCLVASTYEYDIPTGFAAINEAYRADSDGDFVEPIPLRHLSVDRENRKLIFDKEEARANSYIVAGRYVQLIGQKYDTEPATETAEFSINTTPILWRAKAGLHANEGDDAMMKAALAMAEADLDDEATPLWPGSLVVEE